MQRPEHLYQACAPGLPRTSRRSRLETARPDNLPVQLTSFIGREQEIAGVCRLLEKHRLVTLTGSGGTGKTRLSLQVAEEMLDNISRTAPGWWSWPRWQTRI